jgi:hypothetical protein
MKLISKKAALEQGARGLAVPQSGLRPESFAWLRAGGAPARSLPVMVAFFPDGTRHIVDGRHRITLAREAQQTEISGRLVLYGPRGGIRWSYTGRFPI